MNLELMGMEELNEQELMTVDGGRHHWNSHNWTQAVVAVGIVAAAAAGNVYLVPTA